MLEITPDGLQLTHSAVIEASAGTGKSYTIRQLVLRAIEERRSPLATSLSSRLPEPPRQKCSRRYGMPFASASRIWE